MTSITNISQFCDINDGCDNCHKDGRITRCEVLSGNLVFHTETGGAFELNPDYYHTKEITKEEYETTMKEWNEQVEEHNQKVQNGSLSVDELMDKFNFDGSKTKKQGAKKISVKTAQQPRSKPRILRTKVSRIGKPATLKDTDSQNSNKYNKRFTKTKKPARL